MLVGVVGACVVDSVVGVVGVVGVTGVVPCLCSGRTLKKCVRRCEERRCCIRKYVVVAVRKTKCFLNVSTPLQLRSI